MQDYDEQTSIDLNQARALLRGRKGGGVALDVIRRWTASGRPVGSSRVVLRSVRIGGRRRTMPAWVEVFVRECIAAAAQMSPTQRPPSPPPRAKRSREAAHRRAEAQLDAVGVA